MSERSEFIPCNYIIILILHLSVSDVCGRRGRIRLKSTLTCGGPVTANELDSRVAVVHRCFSERGDCILSVFSWEPLRAKLQDIEFLWLAIKLKQSRDQPGCARAITVVN